MTEVTFKVNLILDMKNSNKPQLFHLIRFFPDISWSSYIFINAKTGISVRNWDNFDKL